MVRGVLLARSLILATALLATAAAPGLADRAPDPTAPAGAAAPSDRDDAERVVFLLQYVGGDYAAAVRGGAVIDEAEYRENQEFVSVIREKFKALRASLPNDRAASMSNAIDHLATLVGQRADPGKVREITEELIPEIVQATGLRAYPRTRPDTLGATKLYETHCQPCHGPHGDGDGPQGKSLDPPPARLSDPDRLRSTPPYVFYNAITLGVAKTGMVSFADRLTDQQRWELAFFVFSFAPNGPGMQAQPPARLSLRELATRSSADLAPEILRQAKVHGISLDEAGAVRAADAMRAHPPELSDSEERLARLRADLDRSQKLVDGNQLDAAADLVTTSYLTEFEPLEPEIDRQDKRVRQAFEHDLIDFRAALRKSDRTAASAAALRLRESVDRSAELLKPASSSSLGLVWLGLGLICAVLLALVWSGLGSRARSRRAAR